VDKAEQIYGIFLYKKFKKLAKGAIALWAKSGHPAQ
jgi:hypothetical protein